MDDARADLHAGAADARVLDDLGLELRGGEEVDGGVLDGAGHEEAGGPEDERAADEELVAGLHEDSLSANAGIYSGRQAMARPDA
jgi:hypothetical protein